MGALHRTLRAAYTSQLALGGSRKRPQIQGRWVRYRVPRKYQGAPRITKYPRLGPPRAWSNHLDATAVDPFPYHNLHCVRLQSSFLETCNRRKSRISRTLGPQSAGLRCFSPGHLVPIRRKSCLSRFTAIRPPDCIRTSSTLDAVGHGVPGNLPFPHVGRV